MEPARDTDTTARPRGNTATANVHTSQGGLATRGRYVPSNPKDTDVGWGIVHLYREADETTGLYDDAYASSSTGSESGEAGESDGNRFKEVECDTLCLLAVPLYMTPSDLLGYLGEQTREDVSHFRLVRTGRTNRYMVLMKFREARKAREWRKEWNGKLFSSMEPENCHVVFVKSIAFQTSSSTRGKADPHSFPAMSNDPFAPAAVINTPSPVDSSSPISAPLTTKPLAPPTPLVELPTCPVCLERMDETTGLLTILCQHVFHCACLEKWRGSGCPVCRYTQNSALLPRTSKGGSVGGIGDNNEAPSECSVCGSDANLWICLICGNVGCGRYDSAHAFAHYEATRHSFAMDIATQHVWDYAGDGYVHRLVQNKADGKLVDLPAASSFGPRGLGAAGMTALDAAAAAGDMVPREKLDGVGAEYAYLLASQLDSQRSYFEEQLARAVDKASQAAAQAEKAAAQATGLARDLEALRGRHEEARARVEELEKDARRLGARSERSEQLARRLGRDYQESKSLAEGLSEKVVFLEAKLKESEGRVGEAEAQKKELEEQNRDLSMFISMQEKLKGLETAEGMQEGEVEGGTVQVPLAKEDGDGRRGKGKKGKGKK